MAVTVLVIPKPGEKKKKSKRDEIPGRAYKRVRQLSVEHRGILHTLFYEKRTVGEIANTMHAMGLWSDMSYIAVDRMLRRYKREVIDSGRVTLPPTGHPVLDNHNLETLEKLAHKVDVAEELAQLVERQKRRVQKLLISENSMPFLYNTLRVEMQALAGFVKDFAEVSFDLGLLRRVPKKIQLEPEPTLPSDGREFVRFSEQNQQRLESAANAFFQIIDATFREVNREPMEAQQGESTAGVG